MKNEANDKEKNDTKSTTTALSHEVAILASEDKECLNVADDQVEWVLDTAASYHATLCRKMFTVHKEGDFGTVKMGNTRSFKNCWDH